MPTEPTALTSGAPAPQAPAAKPRAARWQFLRRPATLLALLAVVVFGGLALETRLRLAETQQEFAKRLTESDAQAREGRSMAQLGQQHIQSLQAKIGALEAQLAESQSQQLALEAMYQELSKSRDERLLAEIEQAVAIAAQQLQLAGNVEAALIALQGADARLSRSGQAQFLGLRKLINRDIDRLRAMPSADISGTALKLEGVIAAIDAMPLAFEQRPPAAVRPAVAAKAATPAEPVWWQRLGVDLWSEFKQLVRVERIERSDPGLLSPSQSFFLRENLKLRLVNARLALLARDSKSFREDVRQARDWLERYFDGRAKPVQTALATLKTLAATDVAVEPPSLNETLTALRNYKLSREKKDG